MSDKRIKIKWLVSGLEVSGIGIATKGEEVEVPNDVGESLINQKLAKQSKMNNNNKKPNKGEDTE
ncbi:MAG: hypothetical protein GOVbin4691_42 [Prokaryotic dsDNA virus sp.]|jgi:hypothetical protein|nr:MAG: hypothetical protein GOVbin4691_42 [Prokaryotic dsDNA virus sp.]